MKIMWICNGSVSVINEKIFNSKVQGPSWLEGLARCFFEEPEFEIAYGFPQTKNREMIKGKINGLNYYGFYRSKKNPHIYNKEVEKSISETINNFKPDILHIFGTEFNHTLAAVKAFNKPDKTIINIQGLCGIYAKHYEAGLSNKVVKSCSYNDFIHNDNIKMQKKKFVMRGKLETQAINNVEHVVGRTDWDYAFTKKINSKVNYHFCNEILRNSFYDNKWNYEECEKHSIFVSQAYYPIKGLHLMIEALIEIKKKFLDTRLYVAGNDICKCNTIKEKTKMSSYAKYIKKLIDKNNLHDTVIFTGYLNETQMCDRYLKSNVFVSASSIENSPNSVGEAMMLGTPTISSDVGGVRSQITHNEDGFLYQWDAPYMLAHYVMKIFEDNNLANSFCEKSRKKARIVYDRTKNVSDLKSIYKIVGGK